MTEWLLQMFVIMQNPRQKKTNQKNLKKPTTPPNPLKKLQKTAQLNIMQIPITFFFSRFFFK